MSSGNTTPQSKLAQVGAPAQARSVGWRLTSRSRRVAAETAKQLVDLGRGECRYCVEDAPEGRMEEALFCGEPAPGGRYCPAHRRLCLGEPANMRALEAEVEAVLAKRP